MKKIVFDLKTKETEIVEVPDVIYEETETEIKNEPYIPTDTERIEVLEMAMLELAEVIANG